MNEPYTQQAFVFAGGAGTRMKNTYGAPKHLQPIQVGLQKRPVLAYLLENLSGYVDEIVVGVAYRARHIERYLRRLRWQVTPLRLPEVNNMGLNASYAATHLTGSVLAYVCGDTIIDQESCRHFLQNLSTLITPDSPLALLLGVQSPDPSRSTFDINQTGHITAVRASQPTDLYRYSWLIAAVNRQYVAAWCQQTLWRSRQEAGVTYTIWPVLAQQVLASGLSPRAMITNNTTFNINTLDDLRTAQSYLNNASQS
ncbi:MAG: hypothetical protein Fur0021_27250 [Candidatus Promineifilaceae bacterium]